VPRDKVETIKDLVTYLTETEQIKLI